MPLVAKFGGKQHIAGRQVGLVVKTLGCSAYYSGSIPGGGAEKEIPISLLLSNVSDGFLSRRSSWPRAMAARVYRCKKVPT